MVSSPAATRGSIATQFLRCTALGALMALLALGSSGCFVDNADDNDDLAPARPRGVTSITGDEAVTVLWFANEEPDLAGYEIWRSRDANDGYVKIATLGPSTAQYTDTDVVNGRTYYYAVLAVDQNNNASDLSPEIVEDTPRPEGGGVTLSNYVIDPTRSGFTFADAESGPRHWDRNDDGLLDREVDFFFGFDDEVNITYFYSDHEDMFMQDLGFHEQMSDVDVAPTRGYTIISSEILEGHVYAFYTPDGHYAKIRVDRVSDESVTFAWAYQLERNNPDLAPSIAPASVVRGRSRPRSGPA